MTLRPYQSRIIEELEQRLQNEEKEIVISSCPSSGKTLIAKEFMKNNSNKTFLVLTHGTNVLKNQWKKELEDDFKETEFSDDFTKRITFGLPQSFHKKDIKKVDYLIVDEAHEFVLTKEDGMFKTIKKKANPSSIIYLTGTPSKFIAKGYKPIIVPGIELINDGYISDLYFGMVASKAHLTEDDFNHNEDLTEKGTKKFTEATEDNLNRLVDAIIKRLSAPGKNFPELNRKLDWVPVFTKLHKTMIACQSVNQAEKVHAYFTQKNVKSELSHHKNDYDSDNIQKFIDNPDIKVLVVVDRGTLGFNMQNLVNVVDLTGSRNIDRIYQLYARVMRKSDEYPNKYFFKFASYELTQMGMMQFYMEAALMLLFPDFISKYNGKNLNGQHIVVHKVRTDRNGVYGGLGGSKKNKAGVTYKPIDAFFEGTVKAAQLMQELNNKIAQGVKEYAWVDFRKIRNHFFRPSRFNDLVCEEFIEKIDQDFKDTGLRRELNLFEEWQAGLIKRTYKSQINIYNEDFVAALSDRGYASRRENAPNEKEQEYLNLKMGSVRPSQKTKEGQWLNSRFQSNPGFKQQMVKKHPKWFRSPDDVKEKKEKILDYMSKGKKIPKDMKVSLQSYLNEKSSSHDASFTQKFNKFGITLRNLARKEQQRAIRCIETGHVYQSIKDAEGELNLSSGQIGGSLRLGYACKGFTYEYVDKKADDPRVQRKSHKKKVKNNETGEIFNSIKDAAKKYNITSSSISIFLKGKTKLCAGHTWSYVENKE